MPSTTHARGGFWEKPPPSNCFMTKCVFSHMCPSSHLLSPLLRELTQTRTHARMKTHRRAYAFWPMHALSVSVKHTHTHARTDEFSGGQAGGLAGTEMNTCCDQSSSVWFTFLPLFLPFFLSLNLSLPSSSYRRHPSPTSPCSVYPPVLLKSWVFHMYSAHKLIRGLFLNL